ncbi:MAG: NUDIX hydrolase [Clostridia bacterium]|nr:NUDIX hydrolase [Clostridia bacterium]
MDNWLESKELPYHMFSSCGLVRKEGLVLLIKNTRRGWEIPGGTIEQGETITDALKREIQEESGILCEPEHLTGIYQNLIVKDGYGPLEGMKIPPIINLAFVCKYISGEALTSAESEDVRWVTPEEALRMVTHPLYAQRLSDMLQFDGSVVFSSYEYDNSSTVFISKEKI